MPPTLDDAAAELYALKPEEFTAARNARAAEASDRPLADAIRRLKKPSVAAWAVNRLVRDSPDDLAQVLQLADELREAQDDLDAPALAQLARQRRGLTNALAKQAADGCAGQGVTVSRAALDEVANTLNAAMMDAAAADAVMTGRLVRTLETVGFGEVDLEGAVAGRVEAREPKASSTDELAERRARKAAERAAREAAQAAAEADRELSKVTAKLEKAQERLDRLAERRAELQAELERVDADAATAEAEQQRLAAASKDARALAKSAAKKAEAARRDAEA